MVSDVYAHRHPIFRAGELLDIRSLNLLNRKLGTESLIQSRVCAEAGHTPVQKRKHYAQRISVVKRCWVNEVTFAISPVPGGNRGWKAPPIRTLNARLSQLALQQNLTSLSRCRAPLARSWHSTCKALSWFC
jgi:hypothetical protein